MEFQLRVVMHDLKSSVTDIKLVLLTTQKFVYVSEVKSREIMPRPYSVIICVSIVDTCPNRLRSLKTPP